jgi:SAM-dependent methyltransferase
MIELRFLGGLPLDAIGTLHDRLIINRRVDILSSWFARLAPSSSQILDVGCGDGLLAATLCAKRPDLNIRGVDALARENTHIPVAVFDGCHIPFDDDSFDAVLFSDVLHHTSDPALLLREAKRVARQWLLIKDHYRKGLGAVQRLRLMDWVGNARFGVALPYNYWSENQWQQAWQQIGLQPEEFVTRLRLYPGPADWIFGAQLHFVVRLRKRKFLSHIH